MNAARVSDRDGQAATPSEPVRAQWVSRQMAQLLRISPYMALVNLVSAIFVGWLVIWRLGGGAGLWWALVWAVVAIGFGVDSVLTRRAPTAELGRVVLRWRFGGYAALLGSIYGGVVLTVYPFVNSGGQFLLGMLICAAIPLGAMAVASIRTIGIVYTVVSSLGVMGALLSQHRLVDEMSAGLVLLTGVMTLVVVVVSEANLRSRLRAETDAHLGRQAVDLLLQDFEAQSDDWIWEADAQGRLQRVAKRMALALGYAGPGQVQGLHLVDVMQGLRSAPTQGKGVPTDGLQRLRTYLLQPVTFHGVDVHPVGVLPVVGRWSHGVPCWSVSAVPVLDPQGRLQGWRGVIRDVTLLRAQAQELVRLTQTDTLTGLSNRHTFQRRCNDAAIGWRLLLSAGHLAESFTSAAPPLVIRDSDANTSALLLSVFLFNVDRFQTVNESHGHVVGDQLLQAVAHRLARCVEQQLGTHVTLLARWSSDEFALLVEQPHTARQRDELVTCLLAAVRQPWTCEAGPVEVSVSAGVASLSGRSMGEAGLSHRLLQNAVAALAQAKLGGRNRLQVFDAALGARMARRSTILQDLGLLLEASPRHGAADLTDVGRLVVHYQPQFTLAEPRLIGVEALVRWWHPLRGWIPPAEFVPLAESTGLIAALGEWVLRRACQEAVLWPEPLRLAVNVSGVQLDQAHWLDRVRAVLAQTGLAPQRLELEITETVLMADADQARQRLLALRELGVGIALDDFGTGHFQKPPLQP